jgi:hypothetical protein
MRRAMWEPFAVDLLARSADSRARVSRDGGNGNYTLVMPASETGLMLKMTVDAGKGFLPVLMEISDVKKGVYMRREFEDFREVQKGLWLPFRYVWSISTGIANVYELKHAEVNVEIPGELLDFRFPEGTIVSDEIANLRYTVGVYQESRPDIGDTSSTDTLLRPEDLKVDKPATEKDLEAARLEGLRLTKSSATVRKAGDARYVVISVVVLLVVAFGVVMFVFRQRKARKLRALDRPVK